MPRNYRSTAELVQPDPRFDSLLASKIINKLMLHGKKTTAQTMFYKAIDIAAQKLGEEAQSPVDIFTLQKRDARSTSKLMAREGYGETSVRNLFTASEARRNNDIFRMIGEASAEKIRELPFLFIDCGTEDHQFQSNWDFAALLTFWTLFLLKKQYLPSS